MGLASSVRVQVIASSITLAGNASARNTVLHQETSKDLEALGLAINQTKSVLQRMKGRNCDTTSDEKLRKIQQLAHHLFCQQRVSVKDIARFMGNASAFTRAKWQLPCTTKHCNF